MSPQTAISIIKEVEQSWVANGNDHQKLLMAIAVLEGFVIAREADLPKGGTVQTDPEGQLSLDENVNDPTAAGDDTKEQ